MIAVVSHGDEQAELPLLWQLCQALVNFGYSVTVLDATCSESESNPGLEQLLDNSQWSGDGAHDTPAWAVLPSAKGIQNLCAPHGAPFQGLLQLGHKFPPEGIVVLYCKVEWMIPLVGACSIEPLLAVSPVRTSLLTSYIALKRLLITGKLKPTIINMTQDSASASVAPLQSVSAGLNDCAKKFLGHELKTLDIPEQPSDAPLYGEIQRLALRLLESSVALSVGHGPMRTASRATHIGPSGFSAGSH
ncbi:MAG: hypothetical protein V4858_14305 [Pseudomonadota bacterium]